MTSSARAINITYKDKNGDEYTKEGFISKSADTIIITITTDPGFNTGIGRSFEAAMKDILDVHYSNEIPNQKLIIEIKSL